MCELLAMLVVGIHTIEAEYVLLSIVDLHCIHGSKVVESDEAQC